MSTNFSTIHIFPCNFFVAFRRVVIHCKEKTMTTAIGLLQTRLARSPPILIYLRRSGKHTSQKSSPHRNFLQIFCFFLICFWPFVLCAALCLQFNQTIPCLSSRKKRRNVKESLPVPEPDDDNNQEAAEGEGDDDEDEDWEPNSEVDEDNNRFAMGALSQD
jgi:hypothetical protein